MTQGIAPVTLARLSKLDDECTGILLDLELADLLDTSLEAIELCRRIGLGPRPVRVGKTYVWRTSTVRAWLEGGNTIETAVEQAIRLLRASVRPACRPLRLVGRPA
jgi:hypothetical protein